MKIAILNDTHCGVRNDMIEMANYQARFYNDVFFPYLDEHDIKHIIHLGDYFDRRKYINFNSLFANRTHFIKPMLERGISMDLVIGNHDTYYKSTNEVNSPELLLFDHDSINVITEAVVKEYDGFPVALVPWINNEIFDPVQIANVWHNDKIPRILFLLGDFALLSASLLKGMTT